MSNKSVQELKLERAPPRSAPSMIPHRSKPLKQVRISSEPSMIYHKGSGDVDAKSSNVSEVGISSLENYEHLRSDLDLSISRESISNSKADVLSRTVGTNYAINDFGS